MKHMSTLAKYLRLSSEDVDLQKGGKLESNSISNQRNLLDSFIRRNSDFAGWEILEFCDDGWSGTNFERPAVKEMLEQIRQGKIQCIVVKDLSRFGRDYLTVGNYISRIFPFMGVRFIAVNDGFDSIQPLNADSLETSFKTLLYDLYSRDLSRKVRSAKRFRAERGDFLSPFAPYGYIRDPNNRAKLIVDPEAAEYVRRIFRMAANGMRTIDIARELNSDSVPTRMQYKRESDCSRTVWPSIREENFWTHNTVTVILRDERYIGKTVYGKRTRDRMGSPHTVKVAKKDWVVVSNMHEGIVTQEEFDRAQDALQPYEEHSGVFHNWPLAGKIYCGICGHAMTRSKKKLAYYYCATPRITDAYSCSQESIMEQDVLELVLNGLRKQALIAVDLERLWEERNRLKKKNTADILRRLSIKKERLSYIQKSIQDCIDAVLRGEINREEYLREKAELASISEDTANEIMQLEAELENTAADGTLQNPFINHFRTYADIDDLSSDMIKETVDRILIYPDNRIEIVWNYLDDYRKLILELQENEYADGIQQGTVK